jgi:hypothetical protein
MKNAMELTTERKKFKDTPAEVAPVPKSERSSLGIKRSAIIAATLSPEMTETHSTHSPFGHSHEKEHHHNLLTLNLRKNIMMAVDTKKKEPEKYFANPWDGFIYNNEGLRKRYFFGGINNLKFKQLYRPGTLILANYLFKNQKSPMTLISYDSTEVISIKKVAFEELFNDFISKLGEKSEFINRFFNYPSTDTSYKLTKVVKEVDYRMNDTIYSEGEKVNGVYLILEGEVKVNLIIHSVIGRF